jgi:hypothetical protein
VIITDQFIESGKSKNGGYGRKQLAIIGVSWPPQTGWKPGVIGKEIPDDAAAQFLALKDVNPKNDNHGALL